MERLTKNTDIKTMGMFELAHNDVFAKDGAAWYRDYDNELSCRDLTRKLYKENNIEQQAEFWSDDDCFDEVMFENLQYGFSTLEGIIAILYMELWSKCDLRECLSRYEDLKLSPDEIIGKLTHSE